jgi:hypothetical protein
MNKKSKRARKLRVKVRVELPKEKKIPEKPYRISNPVGRPTLYTKDLEDRILEQITTTPYGLKRICEMNNDFPEVKAIFRWLRENEEFSQHYARAKQEQERVIYDEMMSTAGMTEDGKTTLVREIGVGKSRRIEKEVKLSDMTNHRRLKIDTYKWVLAHLNPKKYGDRIEIEDNRNPIKDLVDEFRGIHAEMVKEDQQQLTPFSDKINGSNT